MNCFICKSDDVFVKYKLYDDRYGYDGEFTLIGCNNCLHVWLDHSFTPEQIGNLYSKHYPFSTPEYSKTVPRLSKKQRRERRITVNPFFAWLYGKRSNASQWVPENVRLLDIGCGVGGGFNYHIARGCDVYGIEANESARSVIENSRHKIHIGLFDKNLYEPEFFDFVTMEQVFEHMTDPLSTLQSIFRILKPNGKLIVSMPNPKGWGAKIFRGRWINWHAPYHLHFFSYRSMEYMANKSGFKIIKHLTITNSNWLNLQWMHLLTYPSMGEPSTFWGKHLINESKISDNKTVLLNIIGFVDKCRINDLITRFFDMLHIGDNQVFILQKKD